MNRQWAETKLLLLQIIEAKI